MSKEDCDEYDRNAYDLKKAMMLLIGCNSEDMHNDLEGLTTVADEQYPCDIISAYNLHRK